MSAYVLGVSVLLAHTVDAAATAAAAAAAAAVRVDRFR
jgi:hypothetical protein